MERKFYTDNFEQLLKEKSDEFRMYPSKRVWHSIYNDLQPGRKWPSIAVSMLLIIALLMVGYWNSNKSNSTGKTIASVLINSKNTESGISSNHSSSIISQPDIIPGTSDAKTYTEVTVPAKNNSSQNKNNDSKIAGSIVRIDGLKRSVHVTPAHFENKPGKNESAVSPETNTVQESIAKVTTSTTLNSKLKNEVSDLTVQNNDEETGNNVAPGFSNLNTTITIARKTVTGEDKPSSKPSSGTDKKVISTEEKAWIEDYAFHNKSKRKKWQDRTALEFYITPNVGYRKLTNDSKYNLTAASPSSFVTGGAAGGGDANSLVDQKPGLGLEAGISINYAIAKNLRVKAGLQANYTNYGINANETNHPILTNLMLLDPITGYPYLQPSSSTLANTSGSESVKVHNKTYQVALPVGFALKLSGSNKLEWYAGATIQPSFVIGAKALLISADRKNYVSAPSLIRKWNLNTGFETYIDYKFDGFTLQAGPQFRYQLFSTYQKKYTVNENLYNVGIKIGILKNF